MSLNNGILLKGVLISNLVNNPCGSCFLINLDFLLRHTKNFDKNIALLLLVFETLGFILSVFLLHFKQFDSYK